MRKLCIVSLALFGLAVLFAAIPRTAKAMTKLYIDFEMKEPSDTFPDEKFNEASEWNDRTQDQTLVEWKNVEHADSGRLFQTRNGTGTTTTTVAPAPKDCEDWMDYTVQATFTFDDDDKWGLVFRYTDEDSYYFFGIEQAGPTAYLKKAPAPDGAWNGINVAGQKGVPEKISQGNAGGLPVSTEEWVFRVTVKEDSIKCYFFLREDIKELGDPAPNAPLFDVKDNSNKEGCVGIRIDTMVGTIDDFTVFDEGGFTFSVDARNKLTTLWGSIKTMRY